MNHDENQHHEHHNHGAQQNINKTAASATLHCLTGCAIGEVLGMIIATALGWGNAASIALAVSLAFTFGYSLSMLPLLRHGLGARKSLKVAFAADTASIATMEVSDNLFIIFVPGAMAASLTDTLFWISLFLSLVVAYAVAFPLNRYLISRGKGHAIAHKYH